MSDAPALILALLAGSLLGAAFFAGLWWTTRKVLSSRHPGLLLLGSLLIRTAAAVAGFYLVSRGDPRRLLACLAGFFLARLLATRLARARAPDAVRPAGGGGA
jgi:F1F0 ATPase subunit 2